MFFFKAPFLGSRRYIYGSINKNTYFEISSEPTKRIWVDAVVDFIDQLGNSEGPGRPKKGLAGPKWSNICCVVVLPYLIPLLKRTCFLFFCLTWDMGLRFTIKSWTHNFRELRWLEERNHCSGRRDQQVVSWTVWTTGSSLEAFHLDVPIMPKTRMK